MSTEIKRIGDDITVIGAGIVELSTTWQLLQRYPTYHIFLIEKEKN